jgi:hypothetical protein
MLRATALLTVPLLTMGCVSIDDETPSTMARRSDGLYRLTTRVETYATTASSVSAWVGSSEYPMTNLGDGRWQVDAALDGCAQGFQLRYSVRYELTASSSTTKTEPPGSTPALGGILKWIAPGVKGLPCTRTTVFRVNSTAILDDVTPGDGFCDANPPGSGTRLCTLKAAIDETNAIAGPATIQLPAGTYAAPLYFTPRDDLVIEGIAPGVVVGHLSIYNSVRPPTVELRDLTVDGGVRSNEGSLRLNRVTVRNSRLGTTMGGVVALGLLAIEDSTIIDNEGPGIRLQGTRARIERSLITGNSHGGIYCLPSSEADLQVSDSTLTANRGFLGGIGAEGNCRIELRGATISNNTRSYALDYFTSGSGGLSLAPGATVLMANTILAGNVNTREPGSPDCGFTGEAPSIDSYGHNLIQSPGACVVRALLERPDFSGPAGLGALADNGGPTRTLLPLSGSAALGAAAPDPASDAFTAACTHRDQRGTLRGSNCDIGAVQVSP